MGAKISCAHTTYWNKLRVDNGFTIREVAEYLNVTVQKAGAYFSGQLLPNDQTIKQLCELFGVEEYVGSREFQAAYKAYDTLRKRKCVYHEGAQKPAPVDEAHVQDVLAQAQAFNDRVAAETNPKPEANPDIFEMVYGVLSFEEFNAFFDAVAGKQGNPLKLVYGKVSFEAYKKIAEIIKEG